MTRAVLALALAECGFRVDAGESTPERVCARNQGACVGLIAERELELFDGAFWRVRALSNGNSVDLTTRRPAQLIGVLTDTFSGRTVGGAR